MGIGLNSIYKRDNTQYFFHSMVSPENLPRLQRSGGSQAENWHLDGPQIS